MENPSKPHVEDIENFAGGFRQASHFAVDRNQNRPGWGRRELDDNLLREGMALAINLLRHDFAADALLLPAGWQVAAARRFLGQAGRQSLGFPAVPGHSYTFVHVRLNDSPFLGPDDDIGANPGFLGLLRSRWFD